MSTQNSFESLQLFYSHKQRAVFYLLLCVLLCGKLMWMYIEFLDFSKNSVYQAKATLVNIYPKQEYDVFKFQASDFEFFTSYSGQEHFHKGDTLWVMVLTGNISFLDYLRGFYAPSFNIYKQNSPHSFGTLLSQEIDKQHDSVLTSSLFQALFLAVPLHQDVREVCAKYGVSHLVAISGFHLGLLSLFIFWVCYYPYKFLQQKYFPHRNRQFDIGMITIGVLLFYLLLTGMVPSLLRAFAMFVFGVILLRSNIKILSFETLSVVVAMILALFPTLLFSLSLWFSVAGVFYIYLFLHYFQNLPRVWQFVLFNIWIFMAMNPITHFFFPMTSWVQLLSPLMTLAFSLFYPLELVLHLFGLGGLLDDAIMWWISYEVSFFDVASPLWFFVVYGAVSLFSVFSLQAFYLLNLLLLVFNITLYLGRPLSFF